MSESFIAALVGALTALITSTIAGWVSFSSIRTEFKSKYHSELITRQIQSCENLWSVLAIASRTMGEKRLIVKNENSATISVEQARKLYDDLTSVFTSPSGLYFSRNLRLSLFDLRDFLSEEILLEAKEEASFQWSKTKANELDGYIQNLRNAIRHEVGAEDLKLANVNRPV